MHPAAAHHPTHPTEAPMHQPAPHPGSADGETAGTSQPLPVQLPQDGFCNAAIGDYGPRCGRPAREYQAGWRCQDHLPRPFRPLTMRPGADS